MAEIKNALIESTSLGIEDHGIMTFWLHLAYPSGGQGFGGFALDIWHEQDRRRVGTAFGLEAIMQTLRVVGVEKWEELPGKYIRVDADSSQIHRIGNIMEDDWLDLEEMAAAWKLRE